MVYVFVVIKNSLAQSDTIKWFLLYFLNLKTCHKKFGSIQTLWAHMTVYRTEVFLPFGRQREGDRQSSGLERDEVSGPPFAVEGSFPRFTVLKLLTDQVATANGRTLK